MHILVDLQALQTAGSRHRGIGRYSLALFKAMVQAGRDIRISAMFNSAFEAEFEEAKAWIGDAIPSDRIFLFDTPGNSARYFQNNAWRATAAAALLEARVESVAPDFVHVASLFESFTDDSVTTIGRNSAGWSATIYDLIPWYHQDVYLQHPDVRSCYMAKLDLARHAELLFAISESARQEVIDTLHQPAERVINILGDVDSHFKKMHVAESKRVPLLRRLGVQQDFVMYTAGIDFRKNIEGLIEAYATLPHYLRGRHQLVIVCSIAAEQRERLVRLGKRHGLAENELICTGFVTDDELADLYRLCRLFVFPSIHEGFGMPILEAMRCGAPVVGSNCSSMPEILGINDAQFDPRSIVSIGNKIAQALQDADFLAALKENSEIQQARFSWAESARRVLDGFEAEHEKRGRTRRLISVGEPLKRPRLAFVSPLPPEQSGIADYSAELIPALSEFYDVTLVTDLPSVADPWLNGVYPTCSTFRFEQYAQQFDRILYQIGNSTFHIDALRLLRNHPGVVVLHDFYLSNLFDSLDVGGKKPGVFRRELYRSHGYAALNRLSAETFPGAKSPLEAAIWKYPCSRFVFEQSYGTIVHSTFSTSAARSYYGVEGQDAIRQIAQLHEMPHRSSRGAARAILGISEDAVLVCSFGVIGRTKLNEELIRTWCNSDLAKRPNHFLRFVGTMSGSPYESSLNDLIASFDAKDQIQFTGFADATTFRQHLEAANCAVQLRTNSRGETSRAVLDCFAYGLPVVVNRHGTLAELPSDTAMQIADRFSDQELASAILTILDDSPERERRTEKGLAFIRDNLDSKKIARDYFAAIEAFYVSNANRKLDRFLADLIRRPSPRPEAGDLERVALIAEKITRPSRTRHCLLDISACLHRPDDIPMQQQLVSLLRELISLDLPGIRVETIYRDDATYRFARSQTPALLGIENFESSDEIVDFQLGDLFIGLGQDTGFIPSGAAWVRKYRLEGLESFFIVFSNDSTTSSSDPRTYRNRVDLDWLAAVAPLADGLIAESRHLIDELDRKLHRISPKRVGALPLYQLESRKNNEIDRPAGSIRSTDTSENPQFETTIISLFSIPALVVPAVHWRPRVGFALGIESVRAWTHTGVIDLDALHHSATSGFFLFGPYRFLKRGRYGLEVYGKFGITCQSDARIDVVSNGGAVVHWQSSLREGNELRFAFAIECDASDVEVRIWLNACDTASLTGYHVFLLENSEFLGQLAT